MREESAAPRDGSAPRRAPARAAGRRSPTGRRPATRLFAFDRGFGERVLAGADEAGRGCLAGPLVVAAVCLDLERLRGRPRRLLGDLDDSKRLDPATRFRLSDVLLAHADQIVVRMAGPATIDRDGLHVTNLRLLAEALAALRPCPEVALVDGFRLGPAAPAHRAVPGGDRRSAAVAAASIIAKTTRDRLMAGPVARAYPGYGFDRHVGYATPDHQEAIRAVGVSPVHRRSFRSSAYPWVEEEADAGGPPGP